MSPCAKQTTMPCISAFARRAWGHPTGSSNIFKFRVVTSTIGMMQLSAHRLADGNKRDRPFVPRPRIELVQLATKAQAYHRIRRACGSVAGSGGEVFKRTVLYILGVLACSFTDHIYCTVDTQQPGARQNTS
jgi:hypothetical protein